MAFRKNLWKLQVIEKNDYNVEFDRPVTKEEAIWQYEASDSNIMLVEIDQFVDTLEVVSAE